MGVRPEGGYRIIITGNRRHQHPFRGETVETLSRKYTLFNVPVGPGVMRPVTLLVMLLSVSRPAKEVVLAVGSNGQVFQQTFISLQSELSDDFEVKKYCITQNGTVGDFRKVMQAVQPRLAVLIDNKSIYLYRNYQQSLPRDERIVPSVAIMGIMLEEVIGCLKNACGISYEIPIVTGVVNFRAVSSRSLKKVGVVHREYLRGFIERNAVFCKREGIRLVTVALPNKTDSYNPFIKKALRQLADEKIEAIWVPNDNALLQSDIIRKEWIPFVKKMRIPVIVGIEALANPELDFGTFAVLPDHEALGKQTAEMVYDVMDNNWRCEEHRVDPPLAIYKIINLRQATKLFKIKDAQLDGVDKKWK